MLRGAHGKSQRHRDREGVVLGCRLLYITHWMILTAHRCSLRGAVAPHTVTCPTLRMYLSWMSNKLLPSECFPRVFSLLASQSISRDALDSPYSTRAENTLTPN